MDILKRFLQYTAIETGSSESTENTPSTKSQFTFCHYLEKDMAEIGIKQIFFDMQHAYCYGVIPATQGKENLPSIGLIAHIDTIPEFAGRKTHTQIIENYNGGDVVLGNTGEVLSPRQFPHMRQLMGQTLVTTDGTSILGADDKAGVAAILTAAEHLILSEQSHGRIAICFTPDEEIGHGAAFMDLDRMACDYAYTVDGGKLEEISFETFNAAEAIVQFTGTNVHPGSAKGILKNAATIAARYCMCLPLDEVPERTEGRQGFYHVTEMTGNVESAKVHMILRDFDANGLEERKIKVTQIAEKMNQHYGSGTATVEIRDQYRNMGEIVQSIPEVIDRANRAVKLAGLNPVCVPIRGGTDGSQLTFRGLPCPNLGTGGYACHGIFEHTTKEGLEKAAEIVLNIMTL